jgi:Pyruvate/2-oxoacid:ferredoxin oxidoreductase delta subunit
MAKPKVWGDHVVLGLLARRYNVILIVVNYTSSIACGACTQYLPNNPEVVKDVYFFLRKDKHFEIIDPFYHC